MVATRKRTSGQSSEAEPSAKKTKKGDKKPQKIIGAKLGVRDAIQYQILYDDGSKSWKREDDVDDSLIDVHCMSNVK